VKNPGASRASAHTDTQRDAINRAGDIIRNAGGGEVRIHGRHGGVSVDGRELWLSGRYDSVVYVLDTTTGRVTHKIAVDAGPHGLLVWPQPGRFSLGHTGNMR